MEYGSKVRAKIGPGTEMLCSTGLMASGCEMELVYEFGAAGSDGYCIIAYLPTPDHNGSALLIQGTSGEPSEAGGDFVLSEEKISGFQKTLGVSRFPYFEILLKTSWVKGTPIDTNIVAYRTYPGPS